MRVVCVYDDQFVYANGTVMLVIGYWLMQGEC